MPTSTAPAAPLAPASAAARAATRTTARKTAAQAASSAAGKASTPPASLPVAPQPAFPAKSGKLHQPVQALKNVKAAAPEKPAAKPAAKADKKADKKAVPQAPKAEAQKAKPKAHQKASKKPAKQRSKLVRDSFTMPQTDFELIATLKFRGLTLGRSIKKSELLRAGLQALAAFDDQTLTATLDKLEAVKIGRPKQGASAA